MLKKRIIPCLDIRDGRTVKGINFEGIRDAGDPIELVKKYVQQGADELVFLDITATIEGRKTFAELVEEIAEEINIPFTVGGGISSVEDAHLLLRKGADKVSINSAAVRRPELIKELSEVLGRQCVVLAIDSKNVEGEDYVHTHGGRTKTEIKTLDWAVQGETFGAGEILLTSMGTDGTKQGFDVRLLQKIGAKIHIPMIASGGAGTMSHFSEVFEKTDATGALAASVFHYGEIPIPELKTYLKKQNIPIR